MRFALLWHMVEEILGDHVGGYSSSTGLGRALADKFGCVLARDYCVEYSGLPGQVAVVADELVRAGRGEECPELLALATVLLTEPVVNKDGVEVWVDSVPEALKSADLLRRSPPRPW